LRTGVKDPEYGPLVYAFEAIDNPQGLESITLADQMILPVEMKSALKQINSALPRQMI
jgi:DUF1680 family protein